MGRWQQTHETLIEAALDLFLERGYDATGTAQIAERAGVSEMTLFRHFPSKETLLVADPFDPVMADAVRSRPEHESPMRALATGIGAVWSTLDAESTDALRDRLTVIAQSPALSGAIERGSAATITALAAALTDRGVGEVQAQVAAVAMIAGLSVALQEWATSETADLDHVLPAALDVLGGE